MANLPDRLHDIAAELSADIQDESEALADLEGLFAWLHSMVQEQRNEATDQFDRLDDELNEIEATMMEEVDDRA